MWTFIFNKWVKKRIIYYDNDIFFITSKYFELDQSLFFYIHKYLNRPKNQKYSSHLYINFSSVVIISSDQYLLVKSKGFQQIDTTFN